MAATGYTPIQLYRTTTSGAAPTAGNLNDGELAININDADVALYVKNQSGAVKRLMNNPAGLKYPTVDGTSNQVLKTDGAGLLSWVTAVLSGGALGTPTSGTLTNCTGLPISSGVSGLAANVATFLQTPSSANLAAALTDETGTGSAVFATNPTFPAQINLTANSGYNIYASGTAENYLAGRLSIGGTNIGGAYGDISSQRTLTGATDTAAFGAITTIASDVTSGYSSFKSQPATQAASFTLSSLYHFNALQYTKGAGSTISVQAGFVVDSSLTNGVNNYGFYGAINASAGTTRYNLYMAGSADNFLAGSLGIGTSTSSDVKVNIGGTFPASGGGCYPVRLIGTANNTTTGSIMYHARLSTSSGGATVGSIQYYLADQGTFSGAVTYQTGFTADGTLTGAVNNYGFYGGIASGTGRYNLYMAGTADNFLAGSLGIGTTTPSASAILDAQSTTKGIRFPNMTTTQKNAVSSPAAGLVVFDTTLSKLCVYTGAAWQTITSV